MRVKEVETLINNLGYNKSPERHDPAIAKKAEEMRAHVTEQNKKKLLSNSTDFLKSLEQDGVYVDDPEVH